MILTVKQTQAIEFLEDATTTEVYYGGAAGGGKSAFGAYWQLKRRLIYPGTRGLIGRATLKALKETTLATFFEIAKREGLKRGNHFDLTSAQDKQFPNCLLFRNESVIFLKDLFAYPSDPDFDELGSLEITDAFLDECPQISATAKNIVRSRIRYKLNEYNLIPKMLMTGNPSKNWSYDLFYRPSKDGTLRADRQFVQALPGDNENLPESYLESLRGLDEKSRQRLLEGNWEYSDDPTTLILYDKILDCFNNDFPALSGDGYITVDVARFGSDKTVIGLWNGFRVRMFPYSGLSVSQTAEKVRELQQKHSIPNSRTIADEDGVGGGVVDILRCKGFVNNSRPLPNPVTHQDENYSNLKSQCYFKLAERINKGGLFIEEKDITIKEKVIQELEQVKQHNMDKDGKRMVLPKDKVKEIIGRSPDYADTLMMREWFELKPALSWVAF
jgi:phage terminase large subunit